MTTVLVVDDDKSIREVVCFALTSEGFDTVEASNGIEAIEQFERRQPALVVLDILMPEMNGTEVCRRLRERSRVPIVFLSSKDEELDRILGLELGGDDYVSKPFSPRELVARVRAVLRRFEPPPARDAATGEMRHGRLRLEPNTFKVYWDQHEMTLTLREFGIVRTLLRRPGHVYSRDVLMGAPNDADRGVDRTIDSHVRRVRAKFRALGADPVETVHGVGYKLGPCT